MRSASPKPIVAFGFLLALAACAVPLQLTSRSTDLPPLPERLAVPEGWPDDVVHIRIPANADGALQDVLYWRSPTPGPRPLLVGLHSWSADYTQTAGLEFLSRCKERGWHFIHPDFRGINRQPQATASDLAVSDILDALDWARRHMDVDSRAIYLMGGSGGGMASLQVLAKAPKPWAGVSSWVPISDLAAWHAETKVRELRYAPWIEASCGGPPGTGAAVDFQYWNRSPLHFIANAAGVPLDLNTGIRDGHTGSVPVHHSLRVYNELAREEDRLPEEVIERFVADAAVPEGWRGTWDDPHYAIRPVIFRRQSNAVRLTVFDGGHEILYDAAFAWLERQRKPAE